ncbi:MAG: sulfur-oxidizing protein SoxA [Candidatus Azotimanducaceae bacterium]|jgi:sulfur-oxidizing protein SoxA
MFTYWPQLLAILLLMASGHSRLTAAEPRSGYAFQSADTQALQDDDFQNPGMLWVDQGSDLFQAAAGASGKACTNCHADMQGVARAFPKRSPDTGQLMSLTQQIQHCRTTHQLAAPISYESTPALALSAYIGYQSRGLPFSPVPLSLTAELARGKAYYYQRKGQLNLGCQHCHEDSVGKMLRGDKISQGHGNGYPIYRLEWQSAGSLHRRLRSCDIGVRAQPHQIGSQAYTEVELFLRQRAGNLPLEVPAVRR